MYWGAGLLPPADLRETGDGESSALPHKASRLQAEGGAARDGGISGRAQAHMNSQTPFALLNMQKGTRAHDVHVT